MYSCLQSNKSYVGENIREFYRYVQKYHSLKARITHEKINRFVNIKKKKKKHSLGSKCKLFISTVDRQVTSM
jgi:hypothetical protein